MAPLLFVNKTLQSKSLTRSTGRAKFLIDSHVSRQNRKKSPSESSRHTLASCDKCSDEPASSPSEAVFDIERCPLKTPLIRQIHTPGQSADPFGSTSLRIDRDAGKMISYFLTWTMPRDNVLTIEPDTTSLSYRVATVRPHEVVQKAIADDLHMASLLSFVACLMDAVQPDRQGPTRIWEITNQALFLLRHRLKVDVDSDMVFDILNLAYSALYLGETAAARKHIQALKDLVTFKGSYSVLAPHTLPSIMYADVCCCLPGLRSTVFVRTLKSTPPLFSYSFCDPCLG